LVLVLTQQDRTADRIGSGRFNQPRADYCNTAADAITIPGHTLVVNDTVQFFALFGVALPTGITEGTTYFVKTVTGNDITISTTQGGATLDITAAGDGMCFKVSTLAVSVNILNLHLNLQLVSSFGVGQKSN
jgi:hypothetical protein